MSAFEQIALLVHYDLGFSVFFFLLSSPNEEKPSETGPHLALWTSTAKDVIEGCQVNQGEISEEGF
jgi:hypothetical protein